MTTTQKERPTDEDRRAERRAADRERMRDAVEALRTSEGWKRWLTVRRNFHSYSWLISGPMCRRRFATRFRCRRHVVEERASARDPITLLARNNV